MCVCMSACMLKCACVCVFAERRGGKVGA